MARALTLVVGAWLALAACQKPAPEEAPPLVVATVDGDPIFSYQLERQFRRYDTAEVQGRARVTLATTLLDNLITERLLLAAARRAKIEVSKEELGAALERMARDYRPRDFQDVLHTSYLTPALLRDEVADQLRMERLLGQHAADVAAPTEAEERVEYEGNLARFSVPEQVRARQIVVRTRELAEQLHERALKRGASFEELARAHSQAPEAKRGGDLGFFARGVMPPVFDEVCFGLKPGEISAVVPSEYGFHLFQVVEARPAEVRSFEEARADLAKELSQRRRRAAAEGFIAALREQAHIVRNLDVLAKLLGEKGES